MKAVSQRRGSFLSLELGLSISLVDFYAYPPDDLQTSIGNDVTCRVC